MEEERKGRKHNGNARIENFRSTRERPHCRGMNGRNFPQFPPSFDRFSRPNTASMDRVSLPWPPSALPLFSSSPSSFSPLFPRCIPSRRGMTREGWIGRKIVRIFFWFSEEEIVLLKSYYISFMHLEVMSILEWRFTFLSRYFLNISLMFQSIPRVNHRFGNIIVNIISKKEN